MALNRDTDPGEESRTGTAPTGRSRYEDQRTGQAPYAEVAEGAGYDGAAGQDPRSPHAGRTDRFRKVGDALTPDREDPAAGDRMPGAATPHSGPGPVPTGSPESGAGDFPTDARGEQPTGTTGGPNTTAPGGDRLPHDGSATPAAGRPAATGRTDSDRIDTGTTGAAAAAGSAGARAAAAGGGATSAPLLPREEAEQWQARLRQTVAGFVDEPRAAVEEADRELQEIIARVEDAVSRRRRTLRDSWSGDDDGAGGPGGDTERLRLALRDYRELAGRLLGI